MTVDTTTLSLDNIPQPPGTAKHPLKRTVRMVDPKNNPTMIVGIPKIIATMMNIDSGSSFKVWMEKATHGKTRIIYELE